MQADSDNGRLNLQITFELQNRTRHEAEKEKRETQFKINRMQAVSYARVSSKEQEKEGFSIPAQQKQLQSYAQAEAFEIVQEYVDVETAKHTGRTNFE